MKSSSKNKSEMNSLNPSDCPLDYLSGLPDPPADLLAGLSDPPCGLLTHQIATQTLWLPSWLSIWPPKLSNLLANLSDILAGLPDSVASKSYSDILYVVPYVINPFWAAV